MLPVPIPKILINDKEGSSSSLESLRPSLTKTSTESLFKYDIASNVSTAPSTPPKSDSISSEESQVTTHSFNIEEDPYVPIPECFLHSFTITEVNYRQFIKKSNVMFLKENPIIFFIQKKLIWVVIDWDEFFGILITKQ